MITMTDEQLEKVDLIDTIFNAVSLDQLKEFAESEKVVSILKGKNQDLSLLRKVVQEHDLLFLEVAVLKGDLDMMKNDIQMLTKLLLTPYDYNSSANANALKSRHNIY